MAQFDPRRQPMRFAPHLLTFCAAVAVAGLVWRVAEPFDKPMEPPLSPEAVAALEARAFAAAAAQPGMTLPESVPVKVRPGETFEQAVQRTGVTRDEARDVVRTLADSFDVVNIKAGLAFQAAVTKPRTGRGSARLVGLTMRTGPATSLTVSRNFDGALRLRELEERVVSETTVAMGEIHGSLYTSAAALGATPAVTSQVGKMFAHKLDFSRDIKAGDEFTLVFDRQVTESGRTVETGELLFAEIKAKGGSTRFYRFQPRGASKAQYFDENGKNIRGFLLRTPVDGARMSSNFGMRRHPISGYRKMHQGIDFAAGTGTPVVAAGDGVVVEARRWGGYGNWVRIRHTNGWETGYAHLSRFARGLRPGQRVNQGQVIAYVGSTGASTGPHLHYEVWQGGRRTNPSGARVPQGTILSGADLQAFRAQKARIDSMIAAKASERLQLASNTAAPSASATDLRPAQAPTSRGAA